MAITGNLQAFRTKEIIIYNTLEFLDKKENRYKEAAINKLIEYAAYYNTPLRKSNGATDLQKDLKDFVLNHSGVIESVPRLYNSLKNS